MYVKLQLARYQLYKVFQDSMAVGVVPKPELMYNGDGFSLMVHNITYL